MLASHELTQQEQPRKAIPMGDRVNHWNKLREASPFGLQCSCGNRVNIFTTNNVKDPLGSRNLFEVEQHSCEPALGPRTLLWRTVPAIPRDREQLDGGSGWN